MKPALAYGLVAAVCMSAWVLAEYALGLHSTQIGIGRYTSAGTDVILFLTLWRLLHVHLRDTDRPALPWGEGLLHGLVGGLVATMGFYVFLSVYLNFIHPDYPYVQLEWLVARQREAGIPEAEIRAMARRYLWRMGPVGLPVTIFSLHLALAALASPILTGWVNWRRQTAVGRTWTRP